MSLVRMAERLGKPGDGRLSNDQVYTSEPIQLDLAHGGQAGPFPALPPTDPAFPPHNQHREPRVNRELGNSVHVELALSAKLAEMNRIYTVNKLNRRSV